MLAGLSHDRDAIERVLEYGTNRFDRERLGPPPVLPLADEPHVTAWRHYRTEAGGDAFGYLQRRLPQLRIPVRQGVSGTEAYGRVVRRGEAFAEASFGGVLQLARPDAFTFEIHNHPAGALPVLSTSHRDDFTVLYQALGCRNEPIALSPSVNAHMVAGLVNWDRVGRYRERWLAEPGTGRTEAAWAAERQRVAESAPGTFRDRLVLTHDAPYSGVSAEMLGLGMDEQAWRRVSQALRLEHEFTHYATKRLFGGMYVNLLDETIADFMGITAALDDYRASWFLAFLGLEDWPRVRASGRVHAYRRSLDDASFELVCMLTVAVATHLEQLHGASDAQGARSRFFLALTSLSLEQLGGPEYDREFAHASDAARALLHVAPSNE